MRDTPSKQPRLPVSESRDAPSSLDCERRVDAGPSSDEECFAGEDNTLASMAKYKMGRLAEWIPANVKVLGRPRFQPEPSAHPSRYESRAIGGGSNEIMLQIIAKRMKLSG